MAGFFGDWFGGRLAPLFGEGIKDVPVRGNRPLRLLPGLAHALYLEFPGDRRPDSFTFHLAAALDINAARWLPDRDDLKPHDPETGRTDSTLQSDS